MNVLQLSKYYPPSHGGLELVAEFFSRAAQDLNHHTSVISLGAETKNYHGRYGEQVIQCKEDLKVSSSPLSMAYFKAVKVAFRDRQPDYVLVHLPHPFAHEIAKRIRSTHPKVKLLGIYHSDVVNQVLLRDLYHWHFKRHLSSYDAFIYSSPQLQVSSPVLRQISSSQQRVIPFCVERPVSARAWESGRFRGKFIAIGRMVPYKGFEFLVKSFASLPYQLTLVGGGPLRQQLEAMAPANVRFAGEITESEKYRLMSEHDALIMSSINRSEAYGMTIVEAFSIGLPVVAANIDSGVSFLVREGETGLKFPIQDASGLALQLDRLKTEDGLAQRLSQASHRFYQAELSYEAFRGKLQSLLGNL